MAHNVIIYTDGSARGNPGPGGYGVLLKSGSHYKEMSEGYRLTTNNRMELLAVIKGLETLKNRGSIVDVYTDSKYVCDSVEKGWLFDWEIQRFKKKKNIDLWKRFLQIYRIHNVKLHWIKGHAEIPENERCDRLAVEASYKENLLIDEEYESEHDSNSMW